MSVPQTDATTDPQSTIAALQQRLDTALAREAALAEALATRDAALALRNSEYGERIEHQSATIEVLKVMSKSPGDAKPVFDLITRRARELCNGVLVGLLEFDGELVHYGSGANVINPIAHAAFMTLFPMRPERGSIACRAILEKRIIHIRDTDTEPDLFDQTRNLGTRSVLAIPLMRDDIVIGSIALNAVDPGGFSEGQVALLQTFAEQAVIAITSAETHRALQTRTADLQESLEYQTATSDVLKVISRSTFDLQPVLDTLVETAARLCEADQAAISRREGESARFAANYGFPPEYEAAVKGFGDFALDRNSPLATHRAMTEGTRRTRS